MKKLLELKNITKKYGPVIVLKEVNCDLYPGEVHAIIGQNGAGKSTLMKIIAGVIDDYEGEYFLNNQAVRFNSTREAQAKRIGMIHQELSVIPTLSVAENLFIGTPEGKTAFINWRKMEHQARGLLKEFDLGKIDPKRSLGDYMLGIQQMVEIIKTIHSGANIIIMDEPTSALSRPEVEKLFKIITQLKKSGNSIIFISHFLNDVLAIADRITVLKDGQKIKTVINQRLHKADLVKLMIGGSKDISSVDRTELLGKELKEKEVVLELKISSSELLQNISMRVSKGEIVGLFGYMGAGHMELLQALFGLKPLGEDQVFVRGKPVMIKSCTQAKNLGLAYVPEDKKKALCQSKQVYANMTLPFLATVSKYINDVPKEIDISKQLIRKVSLRPPDPKIIVGNLSGGNKQKVSVSRWIPTNPVIMLFGEPTRGMDVGAKKEIIDLIKELKAKGIGIIVASSEPETILALADRILIFSKGEIAHEIVEGEVDSKLLLRYA